METAGIWTTSSDPSVKNRGYIEVRATLPAKVRGPPGGGAGERWGVHRFLAGHLDAGRRLLAIPWRARHGGDGERQPKDRDDHPLQRPQRREWAASHGGRLHGVSSPNIPSHLLSSMNANFVENELIAGFEWNVHGEQIDLTWWMTFLDVSSNLPSIIMVNHSTLWSRVPRCMASKTGEIKNGMYISSSRRHLALEPGSPLVCPQLPLPPDDPFISSLLSPWSPSSS